MTTPSINPRTGEIKINDTVFKMPEEIREDGPALTNAAPIKPPIRACEELVGRARYHVIMFHKHAPNKAAKMIVASITLMSIIPFPIVLATVVPKTRKATKLKNAAQITAKRGDRTLVATTVATELAASWKPFKKSKVNARSTRKITAKVNVMPASLLLFQLL